ncbi:MAG: hypothetical protein ABT10_12820 [Novosphingobium sp. SCN 63-17]|nr:MAG: hypothetical protein ABT10_12820 [Novosphingobium sp. SCN 63-17]OJX95106.1 MAG: hypothetical protein BGP00_09560 [Novosphingobium sp. 63-713]
MVSAGIHTTDFPTKGIRPDGADGPSHAPEYPPGPQAKMSADVSLAALFAWDTGASILPESYARLRQDPAYPRAVRRLIRTMLEAAADDPALDGIFKDAGRKVAALAAAHLHMSGGISLPRLKSLMAEFGLASPGRARALLLYMIYLGFVEAKPLRETGAPARYLATEKFLATYRRHLALLAEALAVLAPAAGEIASDIENPIVFDSFIRHLMHGFLYETRQGHDVDAYHHVFLHRNAGTQILYRLLDAAPDHVFPPDVPVPFAIATEARRFKVSRMHVRRMLAAGEAAGLIAVRNRAVLFTPAGRTAVEWVFATKMIVYLGAAARTLRDRAAAVGHIAA